MNCQTVTFALAALGVSVGIATLPAAQHQTTPPRAARESMAANGERALLDVPDARQLRLAEAYGELALGFEANTGQTDTQVKFLSRGPGYSLFLTNSEAMLALRGAVKTPSSLDVPDGAGKALQDSNSAAVLRMKLLGANRAAVVTGLEELPDTSNYFIGNDPTQWRTNVPNYGKVRFADVYPGVDLMYYGNHRQLEYDFVVAPGANVSAITLGLEGANGMQINGEGELVLPTQAGEVRWKKPVVYQEVDGVKRTVDAHYVMKGTEAVGFEIAPFNPQLPLVIDPVLLYSTYLGAGAGAFGKAIAVDSAGHAYVAGSTVSINTMATVGALQTASGGGQDAFVMKFDTTRFGKGARLYSTYLGGNGVDAANGIAVDSAGNAYVTGTTGSTNFPTFNGYQGAFQGGPGGLDVFVTKLNQAGNGLLYSTYLGGDHNDVGMGIAVDSSNPANGYAYVTGNSISSNFPVLNGFQSRGYGFVAKLNTLVGGVPSLIYSTFLNDDPRAIAVDASGNAYVTGQTAGNNQSLCVTEPTCPNGPAAFVTKIDSTASGAFTNSLVYTSYVGGHLLSDSIGLGIAVDLAGNTYVTGTTNAIDFPGTSFSAVTATVPPILGTNQGGKDGFVFKLNASGRGLIYSTYLGGTGSDDEGLGIAVDPLGNAFVTGITNSLDFPTVDPLPGQASLLGANAAFVTKINASGTSWLYSTYLGGSSSSSGLGIALDSDGDAYITGNTGALNFPLVNAFQFSLSGSDAFVAEISEPASTLTGITITPVNPVTAQGATLQFTATGTFSDGSTQDLTATVTWSSATSSVATINAGGVATGVSMGTSLIGAASGGFSGSTTLTVIAPPTIAKAFGASTIIVGNNTTLTFTLGNPNSTPVSGVAFTDPLPGGMVVANPNGLTSSCGGTVTATAGSSSIALSGGSMAANGTCVVSVTVAGANAGSWTNVTGNVTSTEAGAGGQATASLMITAPLPPTINKAFGATSIPLGTNTTLTFTLTNPNSTALTGVGFADPLPDGIIAATPNGLTGSCGGTVNATTGSNLIVLTSGSIAAGGTCVFSVTVTGVNIGSWTNVTGKVASTEGGTGGTATANLQVSAPLPGCQGTLRSAYALQYGGLAHAASALGFASVAALENYVAQVCGG